MEQEANNRSEEVVAKDDQVKPNNQFYCFDFLRNYARQSQEINQEDITKIETMCSKLPEILVTIGAICVAGSIVALIIFGK